MCTYTPNLSRPRRQAVKRNQLNYYARQLDARGAEFLFSGDFSFFILFFLAPRWYFHLDDHFQHKTNFKNLREKFLCEMCGFCTPEQFLAFSRVDVLFYAVSFLCI
jgi:hypothetical protein